MTDSIAPPIGPFSRAAGPGGVSVVRTSSSWRRLFGLAGPGIVVSVGYMDPGNWATDIEAGSKYGYELLFIVLISSLAAMLLQALSLRLGLASGMDLARACRQMYSPPVTRMLWIFGELSIAACDLAELLGSALALHLLLHVSLMTGLAITALDTFVVLWLASMGLRRMEAIVLGLVATIAACYVIEVILARPDWAGVASGLLPRRSALSDPHEAYVAIGIVGATVMPHNLYLHSSVVLAKRGDGKSGLAQTIRLCTADTILSLTVAMLVNAAILVLAASAFHTTGHHDVADIADAYRMLDPLVGSTVASLLFAVALLASGQSATLTGTIAGQVLLDGFLDLKIPPWQRRLITRLIAIVPAAAGLYWFGPGSVGRLLVASQVVLSLQLPFALWPLLRFNGRTELMGMFTITTGWRIAAWSIFCAVTGANLWLVSSCLIPAPT